MAKKRCKDKDTAGLQKELERNQRESSLGRPITVGEAREPIESALQLAIIEWLPDRHSRGGLRVSLIGLHFA
jgi:hypothetical protein